MSYDFECPYCEAKLNVCTDDGFGYEENVNHEDQCSECEKHFVFQTSISFDYYPEKADCLNGADHRLKKVSNFPGSRWPDHVRCEDCDYEDHGKYLDPEANQPNTRSSDA